MLCAGFHRVGGRIADGRISSGKLRTQGVVSNIPDDTPCDPTCRKKLRGAGGTFIEIVR